MKDFNARMNTVQLYTIKDTSGADVFTDFLDLQSYEAVRFNVQVGVLTGVDGSNTLLPVLYETDGDPTVLANYAPVPADKLRGAFTLIDDAAEDDVVQSVSTISSKRNVIVKLEFTGAGITAGFVGVSATLGQGRHQPIDSDTPTTGTAA